jgi:hypothetical protein
MANIYLSKEAAEGLDNLSTDFYDRTRESKLFEADAPDPKFPDWYFFNWQNLKYEALPDNAKIVKPSHNLVVEIPDDLRGCIFEGAPNLPPMYAENINYWGRNRVKEVGEDTGMIYYQATGHSYMIPINWDLDEEDLAKEPAMNTKLISESIVVKIVGLGYECGSVAEDYYVQIDVPVAKGALEEGAIFDGYELVEGITEFMTIYLKVEDVLHSPTPNEIYIDLLRYELLDYGYYY